MNTVVDQADRRVMRTSFLPRNGETAIRNTLSVPSTSLPKLVPQCS